MDSQTEHWDIEIKPNNKTFTLNLGEIWEYRDLLLLYVRRDIVTVYKQTILGPLWFIIQPMFTTIIYMFVFGGIANISTDGLPQMLFYLANILSWSYFADCLGRASSTFAGNASVFSKVYFPRLVVPLSGTISNLFRLGIQMILFLVVYIYFVANGSDVRPTMYILLLPVFLLMIAGLGFGFGIIISSMTAKYRDLAILFGFLTQLWMYATPIIYPLSVMEANYSKYMWMIQLNPMTSIVEASRYALLGQGTFSWFSLGYSFLFTLIIMIIGTWTFNKVERNFIDII